MPKTTQKAFRLPYDVVRVLDEQPNATEFVIQAVKEKFARDEEARFRDSARRIKASREESDVEFAAAAQAQVVLEG